MQNSLYSLQIPYELQFPILDRMENADLAIFVHWEIEVGDIVDSVTWTFKWMPARAGCRIIETCDFQSLLGVKLGVFHKPNSSNN